MSRLLIVAASLCFASPLLAGGKDSPDKKAITALYGQLASAMRAKDVKAITRLGTPDFTSREVNGRVRTAEQSAAQMEEHFKTLKRVTDVRTSLVNLKIKDGTATAVSDFSFAAVVIAGGKPHDFRTSGQTKDTFVKTPAGWKFKSMHTVRATSLMDGEPIPAAPDRPMRPAGRGRTLTPRV
jgi:ketosteroid isomerase-like protein